MAKTMLFLAPGQMQGCVWQSGRLSAMQRFADDAAGKEQFSSFVQAHRNPVYLLTDLIEESFNCEAVPHLHGRERSRLIQRKLEQNFRNTPFRLAVPLRRSTHGRRDDEMLFSALTSPALILPWLDILQAHALPLAGIYSVPHISAALVSNISSTHVLLLSWEKYAGLRQSYFIAGQLRFSRLSPMNSYESLREAVATESTRSRQYLKSQGMLPADQTLDVRVICHAEEPQQAGSGTSGNADTRYSDLAIGQLGRRIKAEMVYTDSDATPLLLHLLAVHPPLTHYAAAEHTRFFSLLRVRRILFGCGAAVAATCLLWCVGNLMEVQLLSAAIQSDKSQADILRLRAGHIMRELSGTTVAPADMKAAVVLARQLENAAPRAQKILGGISAEMEVFPRIQLSRVSWQASSLQNAGADLDPAQTILLEGELLEFSGDYRSAQTYLNNFLHQLVRRGYAVSATPQDGNTVLAEENQARFSLKIYWKPLT